MKRISLCMIVGNVEDCIVRCLTSFKPIADELCLVRAIGNLEPDKTVELAREWWERTGLPFRFAEYKNAPGHEDWPHVDNFGAARQQSFDMATGDYQFWCDSDDELESGADVVRMLAEKDFPVYIFPYRIFGRGVYVPRERMIRRGEGRWRYPVHECFRFAQEPVKGMQDDRVVVTHLPPPTKTGSNPRNLRILESMPEAEMNGGFLYHYQGELAGAGRIAESVAVAKKALLRSDIGDAERYEILMNLSQLAQRIDIKERLLIQAYGVDPMRREALGLLACIAMDTGRKDLGLTYARQMMATTQPSAEAWNSRQQVYGWLGNEIYAQALRMNGMAQEAEALRRQTLIEAGGAKIALIHATRGRAQQAFAARKTWWDMATRPDQVEHIFVMDDDDRESDILRRMHHAVVPAGGGCVAAWNRGAELTQAPVLIQVSDDWVPPMRWDAIVIERLGDLAKPKVLAVSDGVRADRLLCMAIMTRAYYRLDGHMFHPQFKGVYSDDWFTEQAYKRNMVIEARDVVFQHQHPIRTGAPLDATYTAQNSPERYAEGYAIFEELRKANP